MATSRPKVNYIHQETQYRHLIKISNSAKVSKSRQNIRHLAFMTQNTNHTSVHDKLASLIRDNIKHYTIHKNERLYLPQFTSQTNCAKLTQTGLY